MRLFAATWHERQLRYEDLVAAADVVVSKPGYGIVSECIANDTALLYTSRGRLIEYDVMVAEMPQHAAVPVHRAGGSAGRTMGGGRRRGAAPARARDSRR